MVSGAGSINLLNPYLIKSFIKTKTHDYAIIIRTLTYVLYYNHARANYTVNNRYTLS